MLGFYMRVEKRFLETKACGKAKGRPMCLSIDLRSVMAIRASLLRLVEHLATPYLLGLNVYDDRTISELAKIGLRAEAAYLWL